jgi:hypothetical protein
MAYISVCFFTARFARDTEFTEVFSFIFFAETRPPRLSESDGGQAAKKINPSPAGK